jgi:predicted ATPase
LYYKLFNARITETPITNSNKIKFKEAVPFSLSDNVYFMTVMDNYLVQPISFERLSDGAKRVFLMLTYAVIADIKGISFLAFEKPENSINPSLLQDFLNVLTQLAETCNILIASHSPYILQYMQPENIYIGLPNEKGIADFTRITKTRVNFLMRDIRNIDMSLGDYLFDLMVSGEEGKKQLMKYIATDGKW